eukprot:TRINITY_DN11133_c0_g2_i1.p1 TRINITY_DN11133_c0_g2~~TRINITY_DN11133_c0_g2_i1.p1  ORF type:complete len:402 (+),score=82.26 TRINITY_DN11133_c0_g2_i1:77-1207(+)
MSRRPRMQLQPVVEKETAECGVSDSGRFCFSKGGFSVSNKGVTGPMGRQLNMKVESFAELDMETMVKVGSGSSGKVFQCVHIPTGQQIVVKMIDIDESHARQEIIKELEAYYTDKNEYIIEFYGAFFHEGSIYIALERMDGSVQDAVSLMGTIPENVCRAMAYFVVKGLRYLHVDRRKIHRDIKPGNLLFDNIGRVKITDFGVSSNFLNTTNYEADTFVGTVTYMSPERLVGKPHSYGADVWSLGLSLVECTTGEHPFMAYGADGKVGYWDLFNSIDKAEVSYLETSRHNVSAEMADFVSLCLEKDKDLRPPAAKLLEHPWLESLDDVQAMCVLKPWADSVALAKMRTERAKDKKNSGSTKEGGENLIDNMLGGFM